MKHAIRLSILAFLILVLAAPQALARPFADQWEWDKPLYRGKIKEITLATPNRIIKTYFDEKGQRVKEEFFDEKKEALGAVMLQYNDDGKLTDVFIYKVGNKFAVQETAAYDEEGHMTALKGLHWPKLAQVTQDEDGNLHEIIMLTPKGPSNTKWTYYWNKKGQLVKQTFEDESRLVRQTIKIEYNKKGFPEAWEQYDVGGKLLVRKEYDYKYDKEGNWTEKTTKRIGFRNGRTEDTATVTREIEYAK